MNCQICRTQLSPYLEGELSASEKSALENHLQACAACSEELKTFQETVAELKRMDHPPVPADFRQAVWKRIGAAASPGVRLRRWLLEPWYLKLPVEVLATAAVVMLVVQVFRVTGPELMKPGKLLDREQAKLESKSSERLEQARRGRMAEKSARIANEPTMAADQVTVAVPEAQMQRPAAASAPKEEAQNSLAAGVALRGKDVGHRSYEHFRLLVSDVAVAESGIARIIAEVPFEEVEWLFPNRYRFVVTAEQFEVFQTRLQQLGALEPVLIAGRADDKKQAASATQSVILDVLPAEPAQSP